MKKINTNFVREIFFALMLMLGVQSGVKAPNVAKTGADKKIDYKYIINWLERANEDNMMPQKINTYDDLVTLFNNSLQLIYEELCLEECPVNVAYGDGWNGDTSINTLGIGSTYALENIDDYNNPDAVWLRVKDNPSVFIGKTYSYEDMLKLIIGWAQYCQKVEASETKKIVNGQPVLKSMFKKLQGAELYPNEFAALFSATYNSVKNIDKLCPFICKNYNNKILCANKIMNWSESDGFAARCILESLVFLNSDNFCRDLRNMTNFGRGSCICVPGIKKQNLTRENCAEYSNHNKEKYLSVKGTKVGDTEVGLEKYLQKDLEEIKASWAKLTNESKKFVRG